MSAIVAPERSDEQRAKALRRANEIRVLRAAMKRNLTAEDALGFIEVPPPWLRTMRLEKFLVALPGWGQRRAAKLMVRCRVAPTKTIGGLSGRQRLAVVTELRVSPEGKIY